MEKCKSEKTKPVNKRILGIGENLYMINWYRTANHGIEFILASSPENALKKFLFTLNKAVTIVVTKIDPEDMPIVREGTDDPDFNSSLVGEGE